MEIEELFGCPTHLLFVHAAVVPLPLAAVVAVSLIAGVGGHLDHRRGGARRRQGDLERHRQRRRLKR